MTNQLNRKAYDFISKLVVKESADNPSAQEELVGSMKERGVEDWSDKLVGAAKFLITSPEGEYKGVFISEGRIETGFEGNTYNEFAQFCQEIHSIPQFSNTTSLTYIQDCCFDWIIDVHKSKKAEVELINYISNKADKDVKNYEFYFPVINLAIVSPFKIGEIEFNFFTENYLNELYQFYSNGPSQFTEEQFEEVFRKDYQGRVFAKTTVFAERKRAEEIAKFNSELAIDVLKVISMSKEVANNISMFELNYRLNYKPHSNFLCKEKTKDMDYMLNVNLENSHDVFLNEDITLESRESGLELLSDYITRNNQDELYRIVINGIRQLSFALSISDYNLRAIALITLLESLLLEDDRRRDMERIAKSRLSKAMENNPQKRVEIINDFSDFYQVRHKMVHKAIRLPVSQMQLRKAQVRLLLLLLNMADANLNRRCMDKAALYQSLDSIPD